jgi:predicted DNA-binding antitoxin AbrB/MazE fold protein
MTLTIDAIYEDGVLKLAKPLPLAEHDKVQVTVHTPVAETAGLIPCTDAALIERVALDPALEYGEIE